MFRRLRGVAHFLCVAWFLAGCGALLKPAEPSRRLEVHTSGELFESSTGYRFAALSEPSAQFVRVVVRYPVGSADDPPGKPGLAHLVEHLLFDVQLDRNGAKSSITAELGRIALSWNAETTPDYTSFETTAVPSALGELLELEADRMTVGCAGLTPEIFERERAVVVDELHEHQGASGAAIRAAIQAQIYPPEHPYRAVDSAESVSALTLADACAFLAGPYTRGQASVIVSGAIDGATLRQAAGEHFARARRRTTEVRSPLAAGASSTSTTRIPADVDEPTLLVAWPLPPAASRDYRMLAMVWPSIPYRLEEFGWTYAWGHSGAAAIFGGPRAPVLVVGITLTSAAKLGDATDALDRAVAFAKRAVGTEKATRVWEATWQAQARELLSRWESLETRNELVADLLDQGADAKLTVARIDELANATPADVHAVADQWLAPSRAHYLLLEPNGTPGTFAVAGYEGAADTQGVRVDPALADRPLAVPTTRLALDIDHYQLANGLTLAMWPGGTSPLVHARLVIASGAASDPARLEGEASLAGASDVEMDSMSFSAQALSTRIDDLVGGMLDELRLPGSELTDAAKSYLRGRLQLKGAQESANYTRELMAAVYGESHPYAHLAMTEDSIGRITRDSAVDWARAHVTPSNAVLVVTGQFDPGLVEKYVHYDVDQVARGVQAQPISAIPNPTAGPHFIRGVRAKPSPTLHIDVAFLGGRGVDESHAKRVVLAAVLDSRLASLRGRALTYGFSAHYTPRVAGGVWTISGEADATRAAEAATQVAKILSEMRTSPESYRREFVLARQKTLEGLLVGVADSREIANRLSWMTRFHVPENFYDRLAHDVAAMTLADLSPFVATELPQDHQVFGAFGNEAAVDAALAAAKQVP